MSWGFYTKSVSLFLLILLISLGAFIINKENLFSITKETTTKNASKAEGGNGPVEKTKYENQNKEVTVVEKITLSNHLNEKSSDKEE
ncbi:hypothetical protein [Acinetobacter junii]|uniref:hypothetical protein n=1 Tax=Acinetobacter junii TaxID=40215 RepID=UPI003A8A426E